MIRLLSTFSLALVCLLLNACGGGNDAAVGGTLAALNTGATITLQNNATDSLTLTANGNFTFPKTLSSGAAYAVTVLTQPTGQTCSVTNASGTIDAASDSVTNVAVVCVSNSSIGVTVSGLPPGTSVTLTNAGAPLTIATNGPTAFLGVLSPGTTYSVTVSVQPAGGHSCVVTNGAGTIVANTVVTVLVTCS